MANGSDVSNSATIEELSHAIRRLANEVASLRETVLRSPCDLSERIWRHLRSRLDAIQLGETPVPFAEGPRMILHLIPHSALDGSGRVVDLKAATFLIFGSGGSTAYNEHGELVWPERHGESQWGYAQLCRSGCIEAATLINRHTGNQTAYVIHIEQQIIKGAIEYLQAASKALVNGPVDVAVTLTDLGGVHLLGGDRHEMSRHSSVPIRAAEIMLPTARFETTTATEQDVAKALRPALDVLWQAGGWPGCPSFNDGGTYAPR